MDKEVLKRPNQILQRIISVEMKTSVGSQIWSYLVNKLNFLSAVILDTHKTFQ